MTRVADYIAQTLVKNDIRHIFMLTGGGAMFLNDAFGHCPGLQVICCQHEQACAMAAEGYARITGGVGAINVTTGPGGINALNGVFGAWTDSIPMLVISGQVKRETCMASYDLPGLRQLGDQEADIIRMAQGITKYAILVDDPAMIRYHLEKALYLASTGRPGPCWLDIPVDVQSAQVDEARLPGFDAGQEPPGWDLPGLPAIVLQVLQRIQAAERPVILAGSGVRHAHALDIFDRLVHRLGIPVTTAWTHDIIASDDPVFCGRQGSIGDRAGNYTVQNADLLLVLGARLPIRQTGYNWNAFARQAYKIQVDIDPAELCKPTLRPDLPVQANLLGFLEELERQVESRAYDPAYFAPWLEWCKQRQRRYPVVQPGQRLSQGLLNPYYFVEVLFQKLGAEDVVVTGNGAACVMTFQAAALQKGQRLFSNSGSASMGYDLPAALGAAVARQGQRVICIAGDGSLQLNIQELQTLAYQHLPVKILVLDNGGYLSIHQTQKNFFKRFTGESPQSGVGFPDFVKVAQAYGLPAWRITCPADLPLLDEILAGPGPGLCEVVVDPEQGFEPRFSSRQMPDGSIVSAPPEDMFPFLEEAEQKDNMLIPAVKAS